MVVSKKDAILLIIARYFPQGQMKDGTAYLYARSQVGSVVAMVGLDGQVKGRTGYGPYGQITSQSGIQPDFAYAGLYRHQHSGLYLATYRAYNPVIGRWLNRDPIKEAGGINLYGYVMGNPVNRTDLLGLWSVGMELYAGIGARVNLRYWGGTLEITGNFGVGLGGGISLDLGGRPSSQARECGSGYIARTYVRGGTGVGIGPVGIGASLEFLSGNAVTTNYGGGSISGGVNVSVDNLMNIGGRLGGSVGVEFGSYSNW